MKKITTLFFLSYLLLVASCKKETTPDQNQICGFDTELSITGNVLSSEDQDRYFEIWKSIFKERCNLTESEFNIRVGKYSISSNEWIAGTSFTIQYLWNTGWVDIKCQDKFLVKMNSSYYAYAHLNIPRDVMFNESDILFNLSRNVESEISTYNSDTQVKFSNCEELYRYISDSTGYNQVSFSYPSFYVPGKLPREDGDPYFIVRTTGGENEMCLKGYVNLVSGEFNIWEDLCF